MALAVAVTLTLTVTGSQVGIPTALLKAQPCASLPDGSWGEPGTLSPRRSGRPRTEATPGPRSAPCAPQGARPVRSGSGSKDAPAETDLQAPTCASLAAPRHPVRPGPRPPRATATQPLSVRSGPEAGAGARDVPAPRTAASPGARDGPACQTVDSAEAAVACTGDQLPRSGSPDPSTSRGHCSGRGPTNLRLIRFTPGGRGS